MAEKTGGGSRLWGGLMLVSIAVIAWFTKPTALAFGQNILKDLTSMLGYLMLMSLFVERTIEVFLSAWRSAGADQLDREITETGKRIVESSATSLDNGDLPQLKKELRSLDMKRTEYRADSRYISQWLGLGIGVLVALVGVRTLGNIVVVSGASELQVGIFVIVDIVLTGAVLAGGSEAINKIMKVYNSFMISTAEKAKS